MRVSVSKGWRQNPFASFTARDADSGSRKDAHRLGTVKAGASRVPVHSATTGLARHLARRPCPASLALHSRALPNPNFEQTARKGMRADEKRSSFTVATLVSRVSLSCERELRSPRSSPAQGCRAR